MTQIWEFDVKERIKRIYETIKVDPGLKSEERTPIQEICTEYQDTFWLEGEKLSCTGVVKYILPVGSGQSPVNYYLRYTERKSTDKTVSWRRMA